MIKKYFLFIIISLWLSLIFYMSHQNAIMSSLQSDRVVFFIKTFCDREFVNSFVIRKLAHMFLFAFLSMLFSIYFYSKNNIWKSIILPLALCILFASLDEFHQLFILGRSAEFRDVLIDVSGGVIGIIAINLFYKVKNRVIK